MHAFLTNIWHDANKNHTYFLHTYFNTLFKYNFFSNVGTDKNEMQIYLHILQFVMSNKYLTISCLSLAIQGVLRIDIVVLLYSYLIIQGSHGPWLENWACEC